MVRGLVVFDVANGVNVLYLSVAIHVARQVYNCLYIPRLCLHEYCPAGSKVLLPEHTLQRVVADVEHLCVEGSLYVAAVDGLSVLAQDVLSSQLGLCSRARLALQVLVVFLLYAVYLLNLLAVNLHISNNAECAVGGVAKDVLSLNDLLCVATAEFLALPDDGQLLYLLEL